MFRSVSFDGKEQVDTSDASFLDMPMAVLVNGNTYSAAEFFAAALMEYEAAVVVGEPTVGKGYYQQTISLGDGSAVALSTGKWTRKPPPPSITVRYSQATTPRFRRR